MVNWGDMLAGAQLLAGWPTLFSIFGGMFLGLIIGVIPGMTAALGLAIILPLTFQMDALTALVLMTSIYTGSLTGGGILAVLINTPGTPGAAATTFDGYPMAKQGRHNEALGLQIGSSVLGGFVGYVVLLFLIAPIIWVALKFASAEMLMLTIFVIVTVSVLEDRYLLRSIFAGLLGILMSTIGTSTLTGIPRGTFGLTALQDGLPLILSVIGLFAIPELISLVTRPAIASDRLDQGQSLPLIIKGVSMALRRVVVWLRGTGIGVFVGILPAAGATLASILSYTVTKQSGRKDQRFGEGEPDGVIAAESANNASESGAMAILLSLGIPGSASTAVILGGFLLHGLVPGGRLLRDNGDIVYGLILANLLQMVFLGFFAIFIAFFVGKVVVVPTRFLVPLLVLLVTIGAYSFRGYFVDVYVLYLFGIIGWFFKRYGFSVISFMIGLFLGQQLDDDFQRVTILYGDNLLGILARPISATLFALTVATIAYHVWRMLKRRQGRTG